MKYAIIFAFLLVAGVQEPGQLDRDPDGHMHAEHQIPAGDYCKRSDVTITPREIHAHHCDCTYSCSVDENGVVHEFGGEKQPACKSFCSKDGRRCTCHPEPICELPGNAVADMNHKVVSMKAHAY